MGSEDQGCLCIASRVLSLYVALPAPANSLLNQCTGAHPRPSGESLTPSHPQVPFLTPPGISPNSQRPLPSSSLGALSTEPEANVPVLLALSGCPANVRENSGIKAEQV